MPDIFNRTPLNFGGAFASDSAAVTFSGVASAGEGFLAQNIQINYQQPIIRLYDLTGLFEYWVVGRPQGQGVLNRVVGPIPINYAFYTTFGDACNAVNNNLNIRAVSGCGNDFQTTSPLDLTCKHCVLTSYGLQIAAQDMVFNESLPFMFISLEIP